MVVQEHALANDADLYGTTPILKRDSFEKSDAYSAPRHSTHDADELREWQSAQRILPSSSSAVVI